MAEINSEENLELLNQYWSEGIEVRFIDLSNQFSIYICIGSAINFESQISTYARRSMWVYISVPENSAENLIVVAFSNVNNLSKYIYSPFPTVTSEDNGKILKVVDGQWEVADA